MFVIISVNFEVVTIWNRGNAMGFKSLGNKREDDRSVGLRSFDE